MRGTSAHRRGAGLIGILGCDNAPGKGASPVPCYSRPVVVARRRLPYAVAFPAFYVGVATIRSGEARASAWIFVVLAIAAAFAFARIPESVDTNEARRRVV